MSRKFQYKKIPSSWLETNGRRLDCGPYMSGAIEAKELLKKLPAAKQRLSSLVSGVYHAGRESRTWVNSPDYGVPFMGSTDILAADLSYLPLISKTQVAANPKFTISEGWILITRSGNVGRMSYARPDMDGLACSEHVMRVVPNDNVINPGYLYAYLSSKFGIPMIVSGTYGAIIQHIEPHHIADLPVPRFDQIELKVHKLIQEAAVSRVEANKQLKKATREYLHEAGLEEITPQEWHTNSQKIGFFTSISKKSLRAMNYIPINKKLEELIKNSSNSWKTLGELTVKNTLRSGPRFKRIDANPEYGVELLGQKECFNIRPSGRWISKSHLPTDKLLFMPEASILMAAQGCAGETDLFGRCQFIVGKRVDYAYSQHFIRIISKENEIPSGALFAFLNSQIALRIRKGYQTGSMQQDFHPEMLFNMPIPLIDEKKALFIDRLVRDAYQKLDSAIDNEDKAISLVEHSILEGAK